MGAGATRCDGIGCRDIDSRDVFEKDTSDGVVRPWSCEFRLARRNNEAKIPIRLPSELRLRMLEPCLDVTVVSMVSMG